MTTGLPADVQRILGWEELPASVREIPDDHNPLEDGVLMEPQREWLRLCSEHDLTAAEKGRRTGITYATALDNAITAATQKSAGGDNVFYIGDTKDKGLEFIGYCAHMAKVMASAMAEGWQGIEVTLFDDLQPDGSTKKITAYRIRFASGFQILALSSNPANIRGLQGVVIIDEAAFHRNVQAVIDACLALLIWGGKVRIISTHNGAKNAFNEFVKDAYAGRNAFKAYRVTFDEAVAHGLYERVCLVKGWEPTPEGKEKWYRQIRGSYGSNLAAMREELDSIPREGEGVAIPTVLIERAMPEVRPVLRLSLDAAFAAKPNDYKRSWVDDWVKAHMRPLLEALPQDREHALGTDYGRHRDFTEFVPGWVDQLLMRHVPFVVELHNVPTRQQEQILWSLIDGLPRLKAACMDATGNGATLAEYTADKYGRDRIQEVSISDAWYRTAMGPLQEAFEDGVLTVPRDGDLKNDLRALESINGVIKLPSVRQQDIKEPDKFRHGDFAVGLAMFWQATLSDAGPAWEKPVTAGARQSSAILRGYRL